MLFNSLKFAIFFPIVFALHFCVPGRWRWLLLLVASYVFYMAWEPAYAILIFTSTVIDYLVTNRMDRTEEERQRKALLWVSLSLNLGLLFSFKYYNLVNDTFTAAATRNATWAACALPSVMREASSCRRPTTPSPSCRSDPGQTCLRPDVGLDVDSRSITLYQSRDTTLLRIAFRSTLHGT